MGASIDTVHRCSDRECPFFGQRTFQSCLCHKTGEQVLLTIASDALIALKAIAEFPITHPTESVDAANMAMIAKGAIVIAKGGVA